MAEDIEIKAGSKEVSEETKKKVREAMKKALAEELGSDAKTMGAESFFASSSVMGIE